MTRHPYLLLLAVLIIAFLPDILRGLNTFINYLFEKDEEKNDNR